MCVVWYLHWLGAMAKPRVIRGYNRQMSINYKITPVSAGAHYFDVELVFTPSPSQPSILRLPSWIPGSYLVRDFARNIVDISASSLSEPVGLRKLDKDSWELPALSADINVAYRVYANDLSVRTAFLDDQRGFFNGTSVFLAVVGQEEQRCEVEICPPQFEQDWRVATSLPRAAATEAWAFGSYCASNYHELIDHPVEMADFDVVSFDAAGVPHHMVISGANEFDRQQMEQDLIAVCENHVSRFGDKPPFDEYWFLTALVPGGYGGLEHMNSTALIFPPEDMPTVGQPRSKGYQQFLELCSHEYFHCWNVKRIQPAAFQPFDLSRENFTTLLWAFEGITSYYDQFGVLQSGCISLDDWLRLIGENVSRVQRGQGQQRQTLRESSFDAWTKFYKQDENADNAIVSYYVKGGLLILGLEMSLRLESDGKLTMDDVMRLLWERHGKTRVGVPEDGVEQAVEDLLTQHDIDPQRCMSLLRNGLDSHDEIPLADLFLQFGIQLNWRAQSALTDRGGRSLPADTPDIISDHGITLAVEADGGVQIKRLRDNGSAAKCGLSAGDTLIAINGERADKKALDGLRGQASNSVVEVYLFRRKLLRCYQLSLEPAPQTTAWLSIDPDADDTAKARREQWLGA